MRLPADQRREQLLEVSRDLFANTGFHDTSMDEIAEAAGVTKPVLYQHFPSKKALYLELLENTGEQLLTQLATATTPLPAGRARVEAGFRAYFRFVTGNRSAFRLLFGTSIRTDPDFARVVDRVLRLAAEAITTLIEIPASSAHVSVLANALVGMAEAVARRTLNDDVDAVMDGDRLADWVTELAWFGLRGIRITEETEDPAGAHVTGS